MEHLSRIRINQTGYAACLPQRVILLSDDVLTVRKADGEVVERCSAQKPELDPASQDCVAAADLCLKEPGVYILETAGEKRMITVAREPWRQVTNALIKGLYFQRCGIGLDQAHAGAFSHRPCHTALASEWENRSVRRRIAGGWHDAGDYGKYTGPGAVAAAHLMYAWDLFPEGCCDPLNIPETGNALPDILNEARFELEWLLQMQRSDGAFHHKLTKARFAPFIMPEEDMEPEFLMPVSHCATAAACACLALGSRVYRAFDESFANSLLLSSVRAWKWLTQHPEFVPFRNPEGVRTGQYGDASDTDERFWAACELYAATGQDQYLRAAESLYQSGMQLTQFGWASVGGLGAMCCLTVWKANPGDSLRDRIKEDFLRQSEQALILSRASGYGTALSPDRYIWGSILPVMNNAAAMILNERLTGRTEMRNAALLQWHYALGMNALDLCFVTGFGERSIRHPHHRPSGADGIDDPVPGLISGGPNKCFPYPATREKLGDMTPPAKYFLDETPSADTNEIAVYWNSVTILAASYFSMLSGQQG